MNKETIVIFEDSGNLDELLQLQKTQNVRIISMNYSSHKLLEDHGIEHTLSDIFLTDSERTNLQNQVFKISDWYENSQISSNLMYEDVNVGSLIKPECINIFVNFLKKFFEFYKISQKYTNNFFYCSKESKDILKNFSNNVSAFESNNNNTSFSPLDTLKVGHTVGIKNYNFEIKLSKNIFSTLKSLSESTTSLLVNSKSLKPGSKCMLFLEFNTINLKNFLIENNKPFVIYNRRQPSVWNKETLSLIKNSQAIIENETTISSKTLKQHSVNIFEYFEKQLDELFKKDSIFAEIFKFEEMSFWHLIRTNFIKLLKTRTKENIFEIELAKKLLEKYNFSGIIINNDVGPQERILAQLAKKENIPIFLNQHGLIFDTSDALNHNLHCGVISPSSDYTLVWGKIDQKYRVSCGIPENKIINIGCSTFDNLETVEPNFKKNDYIVLATQSPTDENIFDLTSDVRQKNIDAIKHVCKLTTKLNLDLVIKTHPDPNEFNPSKLAKEINPKIQVLQNGNFASIIKNAKFVIVIDYSTVILDCHILKKPVISITVKNKLGLPTALTNGSCIRVDIDDLEQVICKLHKKNFYEKKIQDGLDSASEYLSFKNSGSKQLSLLLEKYT
ncbi:MAG: hypothetical protein CL758_07565 [Chloroflexi bacterium]|nr:hypothetical protein [Chloroflexota bacterium]|tara:strand:+ start:21193 stop:23040 length:1848 start_codon:yes stop_codon:yes gene_type:complete